MVEEVKLKDETGKVLGESVKGVLKLENSKYINFYYRAEGTFVFSFFALILAIFFWDNVQDPLWFFIFTTVLNLMLMVFFLFKHLKAKGVL